MWLSDEEYTFRQDIKEKKSIGRGAFAKKNGSKSKKCTLPHEYLTKKEREKLNGECKSYDLRKFLSWSEFLELPDDLKIRYLNSLITRFDCNLSAIGVHVFGQKSFSLANWLIKHPDIKKYVNPTKKGALKGNKVLADAVAAESQKEIQNDSEEPIGTVTQKVISRDGMKIDVALTEKGQKYIENLMSGDPPILAEEHTDVSNMTVTMDKFDFGLINSIANLFAGKDVVISLLVRTR